MIDEGARLGHNNLLLISESDSPALPSLLHTNLRAICAMPHAPLCGQDMQRQQYISGVN